MMNRALRLSSGLLLISFCLLRPQLCRADVRLPALVSDNMVLQQKTHASVWGDANPNEKITVKIGNAFGRTTAGTNGHWALKLPNLKPGGPYELTIEGQNKLIIHNVLVGEVWVCSGQSNMEWRVSAAANAATEIESAKYPLVRMFTVQKKRSDTAESNCEGKWELCDPSTVAKFSAVGYFFGREIYTSLKIPVGLINCSTGASSIEEWIPPQGFESNPDLKTIATAPNGDFSMAKEEYKRRYADWFADAEKAKDTGQTPPPEPSPPKTLAGTQTPSSLFHGMISPLLPCSIRGVIWYQGESNTRNPSLYAKLFPALIGSWRKSWSEGDFPFLFVQLPNYLLRKSLPADSTWAELREAQSAGLKAQKTAMATTIDIGEEHNLHPANKQEVGRRLALAALADVYDKPVVASGPIFRSSKLDGANIVLSFEESEERLVVKDGDPLKGFAIAGSDRKFVWADAKISGAKIIVHSDQVPNPVAVRYAWADNPECNLYNKANLPAPPFRTDDW